MVAMLEVSGSRDTKYNTARVSTNALQRQGIDVRNRRFFGGLDIPLWQCAVEKH